MDRKRRFEDGREEPHSPQACWLPFYRCALTPLDPTCPFPAAPLLLAALSSLASEALRALSFFSKAACSRAHSAVAWG